MNTSITRRHRILTAVAGWGLGLAIPINDTSRRIVGALGATVDGALDGLTATPTPRGVFAITRHTMNTSFMLWALVHISISGTPHNLIVAGGIRAHGQVRAFLRAGAAAVQLGTPFAVTEEGDAHPNFKRVLAEATPEDKLVNSNKWGAERVLSFTNDTQNACSPNKSSPGQVP